MDLKIINIKTKGTILTSLFLNNYEDYNNILEDCTICFNKMNNPITLPCNHSFCYSCLLESYKGHKCNFYLKTHRICPYCRHPSSYLPLHEGGNPIKGIHREYGKKKTKIPLKSCIAILKSGQNKGEECGCKVRNGVFCGRHKEKSN